MSSGFVGSTIGMVGPVLLAVRTDGQTRALPATAAARRRDVVPAVQRTGRGERSREPRDACRARRRRVRRERPEGVDVECAPVRLRDPARPHEPRRPEAPRHHVLARSTCVRPASTCDRCARSPAPRTSTRCSSPTCGSRSTNVVGEVDGGWAPARAVLAHEASVIGGGNAAARRLPRAARARACRRPLPATRRPPASGVGRSPSDGSCAT